MKKILQKILTVLAKAYLAKYKPKIVAVTGNTGKTSTKEMIAAVLESEFKIRVNGGNLNNELGVPLTILESPLRNPVSKWGEEYYEKGGTPVFWLKIVLKSLIGLFKEEDFPEILVLEYGADRPGDIAKLAKNFKPDVAVVTAIGEIPVHVEYFSGPEELVAEKSKLVEVLESSDFAVLNADDLQVLEMKEKTKASIKTFGFSPEADMRVSDFNFKIGPNNEPEGVVFKICTDQSDIPPTFDPRLLAREFSSRCMSDWLQIKIFGSLGKSQAWAAAAAATVGLIFGMNLSKIRDALNNYHGPAGRLKILKGIKNSWLIDDTYNASPVSTHLALETLRALSFPHLETGFLSGRKIAILGDMLELGKYTVQAHQEAGNFAGTFADFLVTVGARAKFMAEAAGNQMAKENILSFDTSLEAASKVEELIKERDLVLVKGSQGMRMEKIVEEIMAEPEKKRELLVRQSKRWLKK